MDGCPWGMPTTLGSRIPLASLIQTLAVAEYLNFRHAANALGVAQSSVSARVKALEEDLGILLFMHHFPAPSLSANCSSVSFVGKAARDLNPSCSRASSVRDGPEAVFRYLPIRLSRP